MNDSYEKIINYLLEEFTDIEAIILHGSRAAGFARKHSDYDFIVITNTAQKQKYFRHEIQAKHFEYKIYLLDEKFQNFFGVFDTKLQFSEIIYDKKGKGKDVIDQAKKFYSGNIPDKFYDIEFKEHRKMNRVHILDTLRDAVDEPTIFLKKLSGLYPQIINEWYWFKKRDFPKNLYISLPQIQKENPWLFSEIEKVYDFKISLNKKVESLGKIIKYIYE